MNHNAILRAIVNQLQNNPGKYIAVKTCKHVEPDISLKEIDLYLNELEEDGYVSSTEPYRDGFKAELTPKGKAIRSDHYFSFSPNLKQESEPIIVNINKTIIEGDGNTVMTNQSSDKNDLKQSPIPKDAKHNATMIKIGIVTVVLTAIAIIVAIMAS